MTLANTTVREGLHTSTAAHSVSLRLRSAMELPEPAPVTVVPPAQPDHVPLSPMPPQPPRESVLRWTVKHAYRRAKPWLRPFLWRLRAYLNTPLLARFDRVEGEVQQRSAALEAVLVPRIDALAPRLDAIAPSVDAMGSRVDALAPRIDSLAPRIDSLAPRIDALAPGIEALAPRLDTLEPRIDALAPRIDALAPRIDALAPRIDALAPRIDSLAPAIQALGLHLQSLAVSVASVAEGTERMQAAIGQLATRLDQLETSASDSAGVRQQVETVAGILSGGLEALAARTAAMEPQLAQVGVLVQATAPLPQKLAILESYAAASLRRLAVPCGPGELLVRTEVGYLLCAAGDHALLVSLLEGGELERGTRLVIERLLRPGDTFVDVGANVGMHTIAAARAMQGRGRVIAFEAYEPTARLLQGSVWLNGFSRMVEVHQAAVASRGGSTSLHLGATSGHHSMFELDAPADTPAVTVPMMRLESAVPPSSPVHLIKIDVEGAELEVLEGAREIVRNNPEIALIVEYGRSHLRRAGHGAAQWLRAFRQLGLQYQLIDEVSGALRSASDEDLDQFESVNLLFARADAPAWQRAGMPA